MLTGDIALLSKLFERALAPQTVRDELAAPEAPAAVRAWIAQAPAWPNVRPDPDAGAQDESRRPKLDRDEHEVIALAPGVIKVYPVLTDDQAGVAAARRRGLLQPARWACSISRRGLVDLAEAFERLKATSFYDRQGLLDALLAQHCKREDE